MRTAKELKEITKAAINNKYLEFYKKHKSVLDSIEKELLSAAKLGLSETSVELRLDITFEEICSYEDYFKSLGLRVAIDVISEAVPCYKDYKLTFYW